MKLAVFNPKQHWPSMAWAIVKDDEEAKAIGRAHGFFSWQLHTLTDDWDNFRRDVTQIA